MAMSYADLHEIRPRKLVLLSGPPGAGKSAFAHQVVLNQLATDRPVIYVTTDKPPQEIAGILAEKGLVKHKAGALSYVDAFGNTAGMTAAYRADTEGASCEELNSISMAIARLRQRIFEPDVLMVFDSLTTPCLFNRGEIFRFFRHCLVKFASEGNAVLALMDEGCGTEEELGAMSSVADGILKMEMTGSSRTILVVKHPVMDPVRIQEKIQPERAGFANEIDYDPGTLARFLRSFRKGSGGLRNELGDYVNLFWPNLAHWSGMAWDPGGFPRMIYEMNRWEGASTREVLRLAPWTMKLMVQVLMAAQNLGIVLPRDFSRVKDMKIVPKAPAFRNVGRERSGIIEYLPEKSRTDEHYFRVDESSDCCLFEGVGTTIASHLPPMLAGNLQSIERDGRQWNAVETKCVGLGDPYCELKFVPGEIRELEADLEKDAAAVEKVHERLMQRLTAFLLEGKPLVERPRLGTDVHLHVVMHAMGFPHLAGERYITAQRMGGARSGRILGERLMESGMEPDRAVSGVIDFMNHCKVGKMTLGGNIRIRENCESIRTKLFTHIEKPSCSFTTGFLNGFFSAVRNQHVRESKCIAAGDPFCEWEFV